MLTVSFSTLPSASRVWAFGSQDPVPAPSAQKLLVEVDRFLDGWQAHGTPLRCGREWRDDRFLAIAVDQTEAAASGCSIDGLFRVFQRLGPELGARMLSGGRVFYRDAGGAVQSVTRDEFSDLSSVGKVSGATKVFDLSVTSLGNYRERFEVGAGRSWHAELLTSSGVGSR